MPDAPPPKSRFWLSLALVLAACVVIWVGGGIVFGAPRGGNDWFGLGPFITLFGAFIVVAGIGFLVLVVRWQGRE
jgi:hypothetical protein